MNKLTRYIARTVLLSVLGVLLVVAGIYFIFSFVMEINRVGQGSYTLWQAFLYILLSLPGNIYLILPMGGLLGTLIGLGILANHSELIAMRAAGVTVWNIAKGVIYSSIVLMIASFAIGAYLGPVMQHAADLRQALATSDQAVLMDASATWLKDDTSFTYIDKVLPNGELSGVVRYEVAHNELQRITSAKSANFIHNQWVLNDVDVTNFTAYHVQVTHYSQSQLTRLVPPSLLKVIVSTPDYLTLTGLWSFIQYQKQNGLDVSEYLLQFWSTIIQPVSILILMLMAVPFVFGPLRSVTMGLRLIAGLILGFVFFIVSEFFGPFSMLHNVPPFLGAAIPCALFAVVLYGLMKRMP